MEADSQYPMVSRGAESGAFVLTRRLIFFYFILWVLEGSLRKWVVPSLSMPLLIIRDPVVLAIYFFAARAQIFPSNGWMKFLWALALLIAAQAAIHVIMGSVTWDVALYGVRCFLLHLPLIWVIPEVFGRKAMIMLGKWVLYLSLPMAVLMLLQFKQGPEHWLNASTLKGGGQISSGIEGKVRPAGTFSFIAGPIHFYTLCAGFAIGGFLSKAIFPRWLSIVALAGTMTAMSVSASRGLVLGCIVVCIFGAFAAFRSGRAMGAAAVFGIAIVGLGGLISQSSAVREGIFAFQTRWSWEEDGQSSGQRAAVSRVGGGFLSAFQWAGIVPLMGEGVGSGTNLAGSVAGGKDSPVEGEWERVIWELGPFTGFMCLIWRTALSASLVMAGLKGLKAGNFVCLPLAGACFIDVLSGYTKQPTSLGHIAMCAGFTLAAARVFSAEPEPTLIEELKADIVSPFPDRLKPRIRGRGPFAVGGSPNRL